jgi:hypothetical protein
MVSIFCSSAALVELVAGANATSLVLLSLPGISESRLEGGVNRAKLKFSKTITTTSRVSVRNIIKSAREGTKQIASE